MSSVGVNGSLEVISKLALFDPVDVGLKVTLIVRLFPGLIVLLPPPLVILNIDVSVPVILDEVIKRLVFPAFLTTKEAVMLFFTFTFP